MCRGRVDSVNVSGPLEFDLSRKACRPLWSKHSVHILSLIQSDMSRQACLAILG